MLTPSLSTPFSKLEGYLLVVICSYRGGIGNPPPFSFARVMPRLGRLGGLLDRLALLNLRQFIAANRDFFANVRALAYQAGLVEELLQMAGPLQVTIALDRAFEADPARTAFDNLGEVRLRTPAELIRGEDAADSIVVVYPDALGLGWGALEARLLGTDTPAYLLNGRRRIQRLEAPAHRRLRWHRFLATTRIPELVMSIIVVPLAAILATWDALRGKS